MTLNAEEGGQDILIYTNYAENLEVYVSPASDPEPTLHIVTGALGTPVLSPDEAFDLMNNIHAWTQRVDEEGKWWG